MSKRLPCRLFAFALLLSLSVTAHGAGPLWQQAGEIPNNANDAGRWIRPKRFHAAQLNQTALREKLDSAPHEFTPAGAQAPIVLELPMPDGTPARFRICESPIMAPELAAQYPEIKTYCGQGIDDPAATIRFDTTPTGLHAQILSPHGAVYIDPYRQGDATLHQSYYKRDYHRDADGFQCLTANEAAPGFQPAAVPTGTVRSGGMLRRYRLAVSATGEYTQFHGGTVAAGLAAIVTAINRVDGIYESEMAIRLVLVANNNLLVFTNPNTDPFSNANAFSMLTQNQSTIDSVIGSANYDVGHVFSTGGGGLSSFGVVCVAGGKARSVTGLSSPVGDAYYVDYVAHEIGHEFGANHSYNGVDGSCGGQINTATAYEPGSGSTIMCYAGICGTDDLQPHSDPYFHFVSSAEIQYVVTVGLGADCAVTNATGNSAPAVNAGPDFSIPKGTPFTLTATGSDLNGDTVTFCWEERDLGPAQSVSAPDNGSSPLFRSLPPTTNTSRTFPRLFDILNHTTSLGEQLPSTTRTMNFRVTARDNRTGGGGVSTDDMVVNVVGSAGPFQVTSPNTAVTWSGARTVTWAVAGTSSAPISAATVDILLSTNGGGSFPVVLASNTPNDGSESIVLPNLVSSQARIKVRASGNIFFDISDANFFITTFTPTPLLALDTATLTAESCTPANNAPDPDEVVTVSFALKNVGTGSSTNLVATLVASGGVVPLSGPQSYGAIAVGGPSVARSFTFLPVGSCGGSVTATLQLQDAATALGTVTNVFSLGGVMPAATNSFANTASITISSSGAATPYASTLTVTGLTSLISKVSVTLSNLTHTQPNDLDILLVGPGGQSVLLMSDVGGTADISNLTLTFDDAAVTTLSEAGPVTAGVWRPTNVGVDETFSSPAPAGPYGSTLSVFNGLSPAGTWSLYVFDDASSHSGSIANGWRLNIVTQGGLFCCTNAVLPTLAISGSSVTEGDTGATNALFNVTLSRPVGQTVTVNYATADGTAMAASDYVATNGLLQFSAGQTNRIVRVPVLGDQLPESDETFMVTLSSPINAALGQSVGIGRILDDDIHLSSANFIGSDVLLLFNTVTGRTYRVEQTDQLSGTNAWIALPGATLVPGTGNLVPVMDTNALSQPQRFYRVRQMSP